MVAGLIHSLASYSIYFDLVITCKVAGLVERFSSIYVPPYLAKLLKFSQLRISHLKPPVTAKHSIQKQSHLLNLPAELRLRIYDFPFNEKTILAHYLLRRARHVKSTPLVTTMHATRGSKIYRHFMMTRKLLYREVKPILNALTDVVIIQYRAHKSCTSTARKHVRSKEKLLFKGG